jgi:hypothetical protein
MKKINIKSSDILGALIVDLALIGMSLGVMLNNEYKEVSMIMGIFMIFLSAKLLYNMKLPWYNIAIVSSSILLLATLS